MICKEESQLGYNIFQLLVGPRSHLCNLPNEIKFKLEQILKQELNMVQPDVEIDDGTGRIIISSEPGETEGEYISLYSGLIASHVINLNN